MPHDTWADYYDLAYEAQYGQYYKTFTKSSLDLVNRLCAGQKWSVLDIGAGTGRLAISLARPGMT